MKQKISLYKCLFLSFFRKPLIWFLATIFLVILYIFPILIEYSSQNSIEQNYFIYKEKYGKYDIVVFLENTEKVNNIVSRNDIINFSIMKRNTIRGDNIVYGMHYVDNSYYDLINFSLLYGKIPSNDNEMICSEQFMMFNSYNESDISKGIQINIEDDVYNIVGVYKDYEETNGTNFNFYLNDIDIESLPTTLIIQTDLVNNKEIKEYIIKDNNISSEHIHSNGDLLSYLDINDEGKYNGIKGEFIRVALYVFRILALIVSVLIFTLILLKKKQILVTYQNIGIQRHRICIGYLMCVLLNLLCVFTVSHIIFWVYVPRYVFIFDKVTTITLIIALIVSGFITTLYERINIISKNKVLTKKKHMGYKFEKYIAKNNIAFHRFRYYLLIICMSILFASTIIINYNNYLMKRTVNYVEADFCASYSLYRDEEFNEYTKKAYENVHNIEGELRDLYFSKTSFEIEKKLLSDKYLEFLSNSNPEYARTIGNSDLYINLPINIIAYNNPEDVDFFYNSKINHIPDDEFIIVGSVIDIMESVYDLNVNIGNIIKYEKFSLNGEDEEISLICHEIITDFEFGKELYSYPTIIVNKKTYTKMTDIVYPNFTYINNDMNKDVLDIKSFGLEITDNRLVGKYVEEYLYNTNKDMYIIKSLINIYLIIILVFFSYYNYTCFRNEYASLMLIGIGAKSISKIFIFEQIYTFVRIVVLMSILSYVGIVLSYLYFRTFMYYSFKFPYRIYFENIFIIIICYIISNSISYIFYKKCKIVSEE